MLLDIIDHLCSGHLLHFVKFCFLCASEGGNLRGLEQDPVGDPGWEVYLKSLVKNGYFRDLLEGSREHKQLLQAAILDYRRTRAFAATR